MPKITSISFPGINDRIVEFIDRKHLNKNKVETLCGFTHRYLTTAGDTITEDKAMKLIEVFPEINKEWLLYGKGEMITNDCEELYAKQENDNWRIDVFKRLEQVLASLHMTIEDYEKRYDIIRGTHKNAIKRGRPEVIFGWINSVLSKTPEYSYDWVIFGTGPMKRTEDYLPLYDLNSLSQNSNLIGQYNIPGDPTADALYRIPCDSIDKTIKRGDIIICKNVKPDEILDLSKQYLIITKDEIFISKIEVDGELSLVDNNGKKIYTLNRDDIVCIRKVIGNIQRL